MMKCLSSNIINLMIALQFCYTYACGLYLATLVALIQLLMQPLSCYFCIISLATFTLSLSLLLHYLSLYFCIISLATLVGPLLLLLIFLATFFEYLSSYIYYCYSSIALVTFVASSFSLATFPILGITSLATLERSCYF